MTTDIIITIILMIAGYLIGSIPFGLLMGKLNGVDIREHGSKNIGTTNTIRVLGKPKGLTAFIFEVLKGAIIIIIVKVLHANGLYNPISWNGTPIYIIYGAPSIIGHVFPIYLKFKGGKAVAVSLGVVLSITPVPAVLCLIAFLILIYSTGYVSLGSTAATITVVVSAWILHTDDLITCILYSVLSCLIFYKHKINYIRLIQGTESSFKKKKQQQKEEKEQTNS